MSTIIVYYNGTFVNRQNGAHARAADLIRFAASLARTCVVYSYADHGACPWLPADIERFGRDFPGVDLVLDRRGRLFRLITQLKIRLIALMPHFAARLIGLHLPGMTPGYDRLRKAHPEARMIVNYALGMVELNGLDPDMVVIETHDLSFLNAAKSLHRPITAAKTMLSARVELELLGRAGALIAIAPPEAAMFGLFFAPKPVFLIPAYAVPPAGDPGSDFRYDLLFVGSENVLNVDGLCGFLAAHREWLRHRRLAVAGRVCAVDRVREAARACPGVELLGYVEDLTPLMRQCKLLVSPVDGTGLKIKALEALAVGKPLFGSAGTLHGLPEGYQECAFPIDEEAMAVMLQDEPKRRAAEIAALAYSRRMTINPDLDLLRRHLGAEERGVAGGFALA